MSALKRRINSKKGVFFEVTGKKAGFYGIGPYQGVFVPAGEAEAYALERAGISGIDDTAPDAEEFKRAFVEWFYSGAWIEVKEGENNE